MSAAPPPTPADGLQALDLRQLGAGLEGPWASVPLSRHAVDRMQLRVMEERTAPWHVHERGAEIFLVLEGRLWIDTEPRSFQLEAGHWLAVPAGVRHRARAESRVTLLVMDGFGD